MVKNQSWLNVLDVSLLKKPLEFLEKAAPYYPQKSQIFKALEYTDFDKIKVVILGNTPSVTSTGLAYSSGVKSSPVTLTVMTEAQTEKHFNGNLDNWAKQGVFLMNMSLTSCNAYQTEHKKAWEPFTEHVVVLLGKRKDPIVFLLWGDQLQSYTKLIQEQHFILKAEHPSIKHHYLKCNHFTKTNNILRTIGKDVIDWRNT